ncbi:MULTISPECIES: phenylacetate--CoA ligase PaaK [Niveispirillum]|uniref:Phenylacetate-coenzyme A ligase n=2 Tax=Niveispirillum TaxID=1543704 RepID=A0A255Z6M2_9PROT|nr:MULTISPECIES: phenylacetate--CoA ligase PaaK [Niveispirillum]AUN31033.1 phenylacetate--CoA ligase [Niveispirillum cyanobacteriorum]OYQ37079.1 phenylacetate--CoA ligase [Niveispirillum lacus]GGE88037.1 phenylacetate-coenzyme A ligase [Niveispirillum cyanobacteriorum]
MIATLHPIERASVDELRALQLDRLRWSLNQAYTGNPRYRAKFDAAGIHPDDLRSLDDLARFPFTTKADLRDAYPFDFFAVPQDRLARIHASSGTTGKPVVVGYTRTDLDTWAQLVARSIHAAGGRSGMKVHVAYGYGLFTGGLGAHGGAEALGCTVIPMSGGQTEKQIQLIADFRPDIIMVTPTYLLAMIDEYHKRGLDPAQTSLKIGIFGAEPWTEAMRREIEGAFAITATDIYGLSEVMGPGVAQECGIAKDGPTIWEDHFYPEIIDPETGAVLPDGSEGELVFTSLSKEAMPVIRYRTRDLTRLLPGTSRPMRRMAKITGRSDDMLIIRGVNVFPSQIEEILLTCPALSLHYLIELTRPGRMDVVAVEVEARSGSTAEDQARATRDFAHKIKSLIGISVNVVIRPPGTLARSEGKARRVVDRRGATVN